MGTEHSSLSFNEIMRCVEETRFNDKEVQVLFDCYKDAVCEGSTTLNNKSFRRLYQRTFPNAPDFCRFADHAYRLFDNGNKGSVDFSTFLRTMSMLMRGSNDQQMALLLILYDSQDEGNISARSYVDILYAMKSLRAGFVPNSLAVEPEFLMTAFFNRMGREDFISDEDFMELSCRSLLFQMINQNALKALYMPFVAGFSFS